MSDEFKMIRDKLQDDPIMEDTRVIMQALAGGIDELLNGENVGPGQGRYGFVLLVAEFGKIEGGRVNYISNASREDIQQMLEEYLERVRRQNEQEKKNG